MNLVLLLTIVLTCSCDCEFEVYKPHNDCEARQVDVLDQDMRGSRPAIAEKREEVHWPAIAEKSEEWLKRLPPDKVAPVLLPNLVADLREKLPVRQGMTKTDVANAMEDPSEWPLTLSRDKYYVSGDFAKDLLDNPFFFVFDGRYEGMCLVFFKGDSVESIWCQLGRAHFTIAPPFVLSGNPKPRKAVQQLFH